MCSVGGLRRVGTSDQSTVAATPCSTATATQLPTAAAGVSGDHSRTLSELQHNVGESAPVYYMYSLQLRMPCVMCWLCFMISSIGSSLDYN